MYFHTYGAPRVTDLSMLVKIRKASEGWVHRKLHTMLLLRPAGLYVCSINVWVFAWIFKRFYRMLTKYFLRCSMIEFFTKSGLAEPNILVWSSFCKPKWYLQHPLCTELDLCLTKQKEANVWSAFNLIYNIF